MYQKTRIIEVTAENLNEHPGAICFINQKNEYHKLKVEWLIEQFRKGLKIKLLYIEGEKSPKGFIEYVPGEFCWRPVDAKGYMFIHCIWTNGKKYQHQGLGEQLLSEVEKDASGMNGVSVLTSDNSFMADKRIFLKNGYRIIDESGKDQLMIKQFREALLPVINKSGTTLEHHKGLTMIFSKQCPWVARFIEEVKPVLEKEKPEPEIIELRTCEEAQKAPSAYGVFNLIYYGKILADRYISTTRFVNIIKKEIN
jgi:hypothetical protein